MSSTTLSQDMLMYINKHLMSKETVAKITTLKEFEGLSEIDIIKRYMRLVIILSGKYCREGLVERDDLIMYGIIGLLDAIERYEPERSENFHQVAVTRIKSEMYDHFLENRNIVSIPRYISIVMSHLEIMRSLVTSVISDQGIVNDIITNRVSSYEQTLPSTIQALISEEKKRIESVAESQLNANYEYIVKKAQGELSYFELDKEMNESLELQQENKAGADVFVENRDIKNKLIEFAKTHFKGEKPVEVLRLFLIEEMSQTEIHKKLRLTKSYISHIISSFKTAVRDSEILLELKSETVTGEKGERNKKESSRKNLSR